MQVSFFLAPMAELSHRALRELIEEFGGCDEYFTEMISAAALLGGGPFEKWYVDNGPRPDKLVYQLVGSDSGQIARAAALLDRHECAGIDINMGCSAPLIRKTGAGVAWMASVDRAGDLIKEVRKSVKRRLSVKIRTGLTDDFEYLVRFCRRVEAEGVELITLHPRAAKEKFKRLAKWDYVGDLRKELGIPVAGNGDISDAAGLIRRASGPCDAVMVGRAAVRQPWIFAQSLGIGDQGSGSGVPVRNIGVYDISRSSSELQPQPPVPSPYSLLEKTGVRFLELLTCHQPPEFHLSRARRFFSFFCDNLQWGNFLKNRLNREENLSGIERAWREFFKTQADAGTTVGE
jgi:tRNA-dihydrouridine synthase